MSLATSLMPMKADIYLQIDAQDVNTGSIKKEWSYYKTMPCSAKGIISNSGSGRSGDKQILSNRYSNEQMLEKYNKLLLVDWSKVDLNVGGYKENPSVEPACAGGVCLI